MVLKVEDGKFYTTRDGGTLGPYERNFSDVWWVRNDHNSSRFEDGRLNRDRESPADLVEVVGPVRTVTRKEIVAGIYGIVCVGFRDAKPEVSVMFADHSPAQLRAAAATLTEIADALEQTP
jgi:hypothetical protein